MAGSVRKRGDKWYYSFEVGSVGGKRKRIERVGGRTKKEAELALRKATLDYDNSGFHFDSSEMSVSDYLDYWYKNYVLVNCKYNTQSSYTILINKHIKPALGIYKLKTLTSGILQQYMNDKYLSGIAKNHLANIFGLLSGSLMSAAFPYGFIKASPMLLVRMPKYEHSSAEINKKIISGDEFRRITERFPSGSTFYIAIMIGYYTGCRIGEVTGLTWKDIDLEKGIIRIDKIVYKREKYWYFGSTKTKSSVRTISIGTTLIKALNEHKELQAKNSKLYGKHFINQYEVEEVEGINKLRRIYSIEESLNFGLVNKIEMVCTKENGDMVTSETFKYASRIINYSLGIEFHFHSLRHSHATKLIENGANIKDVQVRLGHTRISTTMDTYAHTTEAMTKKSVDIFEDAVKNDLPAN